jgi:hypothetical protein
MAKWIQKMKLKKGAFGKATAKKIAKGVKSKSPVTRKRAVLARTFKKIAKARKMGKA